MKTCVYIIGAGPAGMMAAITAAKSGADVTLMEHNDRIGKKILSTGNGRCNYTNEFQGPEYYRSDNNSFPWKVVQAFPADTVISYFEELGIMPKNKNGGLYPFSEQAAAVLDVLRMEIERLHISVVTSAHVKEIVKQKQGFRIVAEVEQKEKRYLADKVILSTGSKAAAKLGSDGSGYALAKALGHHIIPVVPALVQLKCKEAYFKSLAGIRLQGKVSLYVNEVLMGEDTGEVQLTDYGISGIPVFQISRYAARGLYEKKQVYAVLDILPQMSESELFDYLWKRKEERPLKEMESFFTGIFNKKLIPVLLKNAGISLHKKVGELTKKELHLLVKGIKSWNVTISGTNSFEQAQVCAGGIDTREIEPSTMESNIVPGLYFAGEIVDVDGICGGYNLQWAWSSGYLAGKGAANA